MIQPRWQGALLQVRAAGLRDLPSGAAQQGRRGPRADGTTLVTRDFDRNTAHYALTPDGKLVYLLVPDAGKENLYRVAAAGGKPALRDRARRGRIHRAANSGEGREAGADREPTAVR